MTRPTIDILKNHDGTFSVNIDGMSQFDAQTLANELAAEYGWPVETDQSRQS
jgi:hypothetical protein